MMDYPTFRALLADERLPAAVVDLDAFDRNVRQVADIVTQGGSRPHLRVRVATKSLRVPELIRRVLAHGAPYAGLMCYSAEEADFLATQGFDDLLIAYPTVRSSQLRRVRGLVDRGKRVVLVVDSEAQLAAAAAAMAGGGPLDVVIDLDASLRPFGAHVGVRRSPVRSEAQLDALLAAAAGHAELRVVGAMMYEAQIAGLGDRNPFKQALNPAFGLVRSASVRAVSRWRARIPAAFARRGASLTLFNGGGTGSLGIEPLVEGLTEVTAGSAFLCPHLFDYYSNVKLEPACFFALEAARVSDAGWVTCQGGGYVASGEPGWDKVPRPWLPAGAALAPSEGCGEVQTPVRLPAGTDLRVGDPVIFRHAKAGELAERFESYLLVEGGRVVARAPTYRGLGRCFS